MRFLGVTLWGAWLASTYNQLLTKYCMTLYTVLCEQLWHELHKRVHRWCSALGLVHPCLHGSFHAHPGYMVNAGGCTAGDEFSVCNPPHPYFNEEGCKARFPQAYAITYWTHTW